MKFPDVSPNGANNIRPLEAEVCTLSPPGFSWWRAGDRGACQYRLVVERDGKTYYESPLTADPIHHPDKVFEAGAYSWFVQAVVNDAVQAESPRRTFSVAENAVEQPWQDPATLLANVPKERPRLLFLASEMDEVRLSLTTTRSKAFTSLKKVATEALALELPPEPDYDKIEDPAERRLAYKACFGKIRKYHDSGMRNLALYYLLTGETKYGEASRRLLVDAAQWDPEGISSIMAPYGDEVGLGLLKASAEVYDWIYDLLSDDERELVAGMLRARADQMIRQLERSDYTFKPSGSHNGRLPGFLLEHAIACVEDERAVAWAEYALKVIATNFPHWAGYEGGWAEGVSYGLSYNSRDVIPFHAWKLATGHDIWLKPFYQNLPWFFYYVVSPVGEIKPFGDTEHEKVSVSQAGMFLKYHGLRLQNRQLYAWGNQGGENGSVSAFPGILLEDKPIEPDDSTVPQDRAFRGVGWAVLHSDVELAKEDFMVSFRSSPYGGVSHGHASQNDFAVMKGGRALISAGGLRFPQHGTPFHNEYAQQSESHNCVLVNGEGAINRDSNRGGLIHDFRTTAPFGYVCGEAENAYGDLLNRYRRHLVMIRPSILILIDELEAPEASRFKWLLHAFEKFELDGDAKTVISNRGGASLKGQLFGSTTFSMWQTDEWPVAPDKGFPTLTLPLPDKRWHFTAETDQAEKCRLAAIFSVQGLGEDRPEFSLNVSDEQLTLLVGDASAEINLSVEESTVFSLSSGSELLTDQS